MVEDFFKWLSEYSDDKFVKCKAIYNSKTSSRSENLRTIYFLYKLKVFFISHKLMLLQDWDYSGKNRCHTIYQL